MKTIFLAAAVLCLATVTGDSAIAAGWCPPDHVRYWRLSGSYDYLTGTAAGDALNNGWNIELERSIGGISNGDLSGGVAYRAFSGSQTGFGNSVQCYSLDFKWRLGPGAMPNDDGYYYGFGAGVAFLNGSLYGTEELTPQFEGRALVGVNYAKCWFTEVDYNLPGSTQGVQMTNIGFSLGYRF